MSQLLALFIIILCSLSLIVFGLGEIVSRRSEADLDSQYYNSDGDHIYYERSLIKKKEFQKQFPHISIRKFSHLFSRKPASKL